MTNEDLIAAIDRVARTLPPGQVEALANTLEPFAEPSGAARARALGTVATGAFADLARVLLDAWASSPASASGLGLALALRAATRSVKEEREQQTIEIVWTGPRTGEVPVRMTREALLDVIRAASKELFIVSFAAYQVEVIVEALGVAAEAGVMVRLVLETAQAEGGTLTFGAASAFEGLRGRVSFLVWPPEKRPTLDHGKASLHVKAAVADGHTALVTSANLTGYAITENMELGLLIRGGAVPRRLAGHFRELIAAGHLVEVL